MNTKTLNAICFVVCTTLLVFAATFDIAGANEPLGLIGKVQSVSGRPFGIDLRGRVIYLSEFNEGTANIQTYSVWDPRHPRLLGSAVTSEQADDIAVRGGHAYVANDALGLQIFDISNVKAPVVVSGRSDGSYANSVALAKLPPACSKCALVGYFYSGVLQIYDVSNPRSISQPVTYLSENSVGYAPHIIDSEVVGNRAYVVVSADAFHGIEVLDLTKLPAPPTRLGQVNLPTDWKGAGKIRVVNDHVYYGVGRQYGPGGLRVFDVNTPRNPTLVGSLNIEDIGQIPWRGTGLDVVERGWCAYAYMVGRTALHVIDVSRPERPKLSVSYALPQEWGQLEGGNVIVRDGIAYVAASRGDGENGHGGLAIYRVAWY